MQNASGLAQLQAGPEGSASASRRRRPKGGSSISAESRAGGCPIKARIVQSTICGATVFRATAAISSGEMYASRKPKRNNVAFFSSVEAAERAGFRACQRCRPNRAKAPDSAIQLARKYIDSHIADMSEERITLERLGEQSGMSPYHLQRQFKKTVGLTPAQYIRARKSEKLKSELKRGETVSRAEPGTTFCCASRSANRILCASCAIRLFPLPTIRPNAMDA